jgi:long-chain acyl-CoA synthetase
MYTVDHSPPAATPPVHRGLRSVADLLGYQLASYGDRVATRHDTGTLYADTTFAEVIENASAMARWLQARHATQQLVVTLCKNRPEWDMTALAVFHTANILCPLDTTMNAAELDRLLGIRPPDVLLVSRAQLARARDLQARLGFRTQIVLADLDACHEDVGTADPTLQDGELSIAEIRRQYSGGGVPPSSPMLNDPDTILGHYATSGTTSFPRLVRISHGNIVAAVQSGFDIINLRPNEDVLNIGPYTHIATLMEFLVTKSRGFAVSYLTREPDENGVLKDEIHKLKDRGVRLKALMAVPKFWIYLLKELLEELKDKPVLSDLFEKIRAIEKNGHLHNLGTIDKAKLTATRLLLRNKLGGYFSYGVSSSSKLDPALVEIFGKLGITVLDIYGATECTGIIARSRLNEIHPGTSGRILPGLEWRIAQPRRLPGWNEEVGMLEVKGPAVARGYVGKDNSTEPLACTPDGWLSTGDLAWVDTEARVRLVGRQKELISWEGGWLLDPQHLSNLVARSIFVKDAMVVHADPADPRLSVYVFPDWPRLRQDAQWKHDLAMGIPEDAALKTRLVEAIRYATSLLSIPAELDTDHIWVLPRKLERTPTHKIKYVFERTRLREARRI